MHPRKKDCERGRNLNNKSALAGKKTPVITGVPIDTDRWEFPSKPYRPRSPDVDSGRHHLIGWISRAAVCGVIFTCGAGFGGLINAPPEDSDNPSPQPTVIRETATRTVNVLTQPCAQVLRNAELLMKSVYAITDSRGTQLDILDESYTAILRKDWRELNELTDRQRELGRLLAADSADLLPSSADFQRDIQQCRESQVTE